mgnify:CR=1 FL=1
MYFQKASGISKHRNMSKLQVRNEAIINAPVGSIWTIITDINVLHKVNPGVVKASGNMDRPGAVRVCQIDNKGRKGTVKEKMIEFVPEEKTVWAMESDTMGMTKMLSNARFVFKLEKLGESTTRVINETYYQPGNLIAKIMNGIMIKKTIGKAQAEILENIKLLTEKK